ncbi:hypothetical protein SDC9_129744 [bioreactor metagenome]|uniref:Uncharacterized protein n=1 Tax=bioreactor metagenome TaxID=1076179 RepID=A0A645D1T4_9ZZZZ
MDEKYKEEPPALHAGCSRCAAGGALRPAESGPVCRGAVSAGDAHRAGIRDGAVHFSGAGGAADGGAGSQAAHGPASGASVSGSDAVCAVGRRVLLPQSLPRAGFKGVYQNSGGLFTVSAGCFYRRKREKRGTERDFRRFRHLRPVFFFKYRPGFDPLVFRRVSQHR